jgi:N6-adenosine-specific RNA methylase IME4
MNKPSLDALASLGEETTAQLRSRVLVEIRERGGATCDEVEVALDLRHQTASARVNELLNDGLISDSGLRRHTRSGRAATVWVLAESSIVAARPTIIAPRLPVTLEDVEARGGYQIIYADPAWSYRNGGRGATDSHYGTTSLVDIAALPVRRVAARDAVLFIWVTWPFLRDSFAVIDAWGFEYLTCAFVWVKYHEESGKRCVGGGFWTRANTEFCLLCTRGKSPPRRVDKGVRQLIETGPEELVSLPDDVLLAPRQEHSAKPSEARKRIKRLMGGGPSAIELFARCKGDDGLVIPGGRVADGFDQWGNECDADVYMGVDGEEVLALL